MFSEIPIEDEYYYIVNERYKGKMPVYFTEEQFTESTYIKNNYEEIKNEIESYFTNNNVSDLENGFVLHAHTEGFGWKPIGLYVFGFKRNANCKKFPVLTRIAESIPSMTSAQISIMQPNSSLIPHIDDTSAVVRIHLGIKIPGSLPELGFRMGGKEVTWKEGELLILSPIRPHYAWNKTDKNRIVFIVDVVHKQYLDRKLRICGNVLGQLVMKYIASRIIILKKIPKPLTMAIHKTFGFGAYTILIIRKIFKI